MLHVKTPLIGLLFIAVAVGFGLFIAQTEASKLSTLETYRRNLEFVSTAETLKWDLLASEKSFILSETLEILRRMGEEGLEHLDSTALLPHSPVLSRLAELYTGGGVRASYTSAGGSVSVEVGEWLAVVIQEEGTFTLRTRAEEVTVPVGTRKYVIPLPVEELVEFLNSLPDEVSLDTYVGFFEEDGVLCYRYGGRRECEPVCNPEDLSAWKRYLSEWVPGEVEGELERSVVVPQDARVRLEGVECSWTDFAFPPDLLASGSPEPAGIFAKSVECTFTVEVDVPGWEEPFTLKVAKEVVVKDTFARKPERILEVSKVLTGDGVCYQLE